MCAPPRQQRPTHKVKTGSERSSQFSFEVALLISALLGQVAVAVASAGEPARLAQSETGAMAVCAIAKPPALAARATQHISKQ